MNTNCLSAEKMAPIFLANLRRSSRRAGRPQVAWLLYNTLVNTLEEKVWQALKTVIDPELHIDVVSLGLIYGVSVREIQGKNGPTPFVHVIMTLTTPGCPLAGMFDTMIKDSLKSIEGLDIHRNVVTELTFDPPWIPDMMTEESRAELGL